MKDISTLFYNHKGDIVLKKKYRYTETDHLPCKCIDAGKLPNDLDFSQFNVELGSHSPYYPVIHVSVKFKWEQRARYYFSVSNVENAPTEFMNMIIKKVKELKRDYYRALDELGDGGRLLMELGLDE
jgi:hypothetical protein